MYIIIRHKVRLYMNLCKKVLLSIWSFVVVIDNRCCFYELWVCKLIGVQLLRLMSQHKRDKICYNMKTNLKYTAACIKNLILAMKRNLNPRNTINIIFSEYFLIVSLEVLLLFTLVEIFLFLNFVRSYM